MIRNNPWHARRPSSEHYQWFRNILDTHQLTLSFLRKLTPAQEALSFQLKRVMSPTAEKNLKMLERLTQETLPDELERVLDESSPEESLSRLENTVRVAQAWSLRNILESSPPTELSALINTLEQCAFSVGRQTANRRWPRFPDDARDDARGLLAAFHNSPFSGYPISRSFLVKRSTRSEVHLELLGCPHRSGLFEIHSIADQACDLYVHWVKGFLYELNSRVVVTYLNPGNRALPCTQVWTISDHPALSPLS